MLGSPSASPKISRSELRASFDAATGGFHLGYWDTVLPINPRTYPLILSPTLPSLIAELGDDHDHVLELQSIITGLGHLPPRSETRRTKVIERGREKEILKRRLATLVADSPVIAAAIERSVARANGTPGDPRTFDTLDLRSAPRETFVRKYSRKGIMRGLAADILRFLRAERAS